MVYRDPESGQYVSGDMNRYEDYEFQHQQSRYLINAANLPGSFPISESDINAVSLDDVLDRNERADLVAVDITLQASIPGTSSAESALETRFELRAGVGDELVTVDDRNFEGDSGSSGVIDASYWESDSPDVLYHAGWVAEGSFADSASGLGGGSDQPVLEDHVHYPREYGGCPQFDDRDEITESFYMVDTGSADISDSLVILNVAYTLVFAVEDRDC